MQGLEEADVAIVGAGGGGAVLALALAQQDIRTVVLDQAQGPPAGLRGEILQPNGQQVLDRLGILQALPADATRAVRHFHFCRAGGRRLCSIDYGDLPPPYNRAIVTLPNVAHHAIVKAVESRPSAKLFYGTAFGGLIREGNQIAGVRGRQADGTEITVRSKIVVGADGAFSKVREALDIPAEVHLYPEAYVIAIIETDCPPSESYYYVGHRQILGVFPATGKKVYVFYMIPSGSMDAVKQRGLPALREEWARIAPQLGPLFRNLTDWSQTAYMPTGRVRTPTWVADGAALIGDAAHAMNPHASQGRMQAMVDAMALAELVPRCLADRDYSASRLKAYETARRPHVTMLQRLADQQVFYWNTANPVVAFLRDRVFRTLDRNARLRYQVLSTTAGLRTESPFTLFDRLIAAGLWPDRWSSRPTQPAS
ncbi:MAG TPA: FAD-dependent monooxygenase [Nitrospira sp.]|nr:FAD-dependent monooxygenase [Nitrospira sp.]